VIAASTRLERIRQEETVPDETSVSVRLAFGGAMRSTRLARLGTHPKAFVVPTLVAALLVLGPFAAAETVDPRMQSVIDFWAQKIGSWHHEERVCLALTLATGILGVVVGGLQLLRNKILQAILLFLGVAIGIATYVNNTLYRGDYRAYEVLVVRAERLLRRMQEDAGSYRSDEERRVAMDDILKIASELEGLEDDHLGGGSGTGASASGPLTPGPAPSSPAPAGAGARLLQLLPVALAAGASAEPACGRHPPSDDSNLYFVGLGSDVSLEKARQESLENAKQALVDDLRTQIPATAAVKPEEMASYLSQAARLVDTCYERPSGARAEYRYFSVLALSRSALKAGTTLYGVREQISVPRDVVTAVEQVRPTSVDYRIARQNTYDQLSAAARRSTTAEAFKMYEEGRRARQSGDCRGATASFKGAVSANPNFYLALYNLGLAQETCHDPEGASESYRRAAVLEPKQPVRDASFYNTYGWFLFQQKQYAEAARQFEQALQIEPNHPKARSNLAAARKALGAS
jgi:tetratricopeptide (TPR) repeat protein